MAPRKNRPRAPGNREPEQVLYLGEPTSPGETVQIEGAEADHARRSLRLRTGDAIYLVDGQGHRYRGTLIGTGKRHLDVSIQESQEVPSWPRGTVLLGVGVLRSTRMDMVIEKASELGVTGFTPLLLERTVARPHEQGSKRDRWHRIAVESLKQCKRAQLMEIGPPTELSDFLQDLPAVRTLWVADPDGISPAVAPTAGGEGPLVLVVGPEGGLSPLEQTLLEEAQAIAVGLGANRLRAETAAVTLLASALAAHGHFGRVDAD